MKLNAKQLNALYALLDYLSEDFLDWTKEEKREDKVIIKAYNTLIRGIKHAKT